jgi:hypothetical protein
MYIGNRVHGPEKINQGLISRTVNFENTSEIILILRGTMRLLVNHMQRAIMRKLIVNFSSS